MKARPAVARVTSIYQQATTAAQLDAHTGPAPPRHPRSRRPNRRGTLPRLRWRYGTVRRFARKRKPGAGLSGDPWL